MVVVTSLAGIASATVGVHAIVGLFAGTTKLTVNVDDPPAGMSAGSGQLSALLQATGTGLEHACCRLFLNGGRRDTGWSEAAEHGAEKGWSSGGLAQVLYLHVVRHRGSSGIAGCDSGWDAQCELRCRADHRGSGDVVGLALCGAELVGHAGDDGQCRLVVAGLDAGVGRWIAGVGPFDRERDRARALVADCDIGQNVSEVLAVVARVIVGAISTPLLSLQVLLALVVAENFKWAGSDEATRPPVMMPLSAPRFDVLSFLTVGVMVAGG